MVEPVIAGGIVLVENEGAAWGGNLRREALPHEVVPALIQIIAELRDQVIALERWSRRDQEGF